MPQRAERVSGVEGPSAPLDSSRDPNEGKGQPLAGGGGVGGGLVSYVTGVVCEGSEGSDIYKGTLAEHVYGDPDFREVAFLRSTDAYVAEIPAAHVDTPSLLYPIEVELEDGKRYAA